MQCNVLIWSPIKRRYPCIWILVYRNKEYSIPIWMAAYYFYRWNTMFPPQGSPYISMKKLIFLPILFLACSLLAQENITYQKPPEEILKLVDVELAPGVYIDYEKEHMLLLYRDAYKSIEELSQEEMRVASLRIEPKTNSGSRTS